MNELHSPQELKEKIQQLIKDVSGPSYKDIRAKSEDFDYSDFTQPGSKYYKVHLSVEAEGSEVNVSTDDFVSTINKYLQSDPRDLLEDAQTSEEEIRKIMIFQESNEPYKQNVMYEYNGKKMYCAVSMSVKNN